MDNITIAKTFSQMADVLEILGENRFRVNAYRRAAEVVESATHNLATLSKEAILEIPGIGEDLAKKIVELGKTGRCKACEEIKKRVPDGLLQVLEVEGMGPKTTALVWKKFGVKDLASLERLLTSGKLETVTGFGEKKVANIKRGIELLKKQGGRQPLGRTLPRAEQIVGALRASKLCVEVEIAGSLRRRKESIGDIDILVTSKQPKKVMDLFTALPEVQSVRVQGETKANVVLTSGIACDLRVVAPESFGAALYYFTGSKEHNVRARTMAVKKGLTVNEYGVFRGKSQIANRKSSQRIVGRTEGEVMKAIGLPWIPPELREDRGEIEAALAGKLPKLIEEKDIRGNLHMHSSWSDGAETIEAVVREAKRRGYEYIAITDHASSMGMVRGVKPQNIEKYIREIRGAEKRIGGIKVLAGAEVDIEKDGSLYLPDGLLKKLDFVVASVHSNFKQDCATTTARVIRAVENPFVHCIGHLTTRLIGKREPMDLDVEAIMKAAKRTGTIMELNAHWARLDLSDIHCRLAKEYGVAIAINTDAHTLPEFDVMRYGVATARRGWLEVGDVVNTWPLGTLKRHLQGAPL